MELKASFDEASNIRWARSFEEAGVQVFHGLVGLKTHAKLALIVRQDPDGKIRRYAHLGTGNYNPSTARFYSDLSLLTSDEAITSAVHDVFNYLTAYAEKAHYKPLLLAPRDMARICIAPRPSSSWAAASSASSTPACLRLSACASSSSRSGRDCWNLPTAK